MFRCIQAKLYLCHAQVVVIDNRSSSFRPHTMLFRLLSLVTETQADSFSHYSFLAPQGNKCPRINAKGFKCIGCAVNPVQHMV